MKHFVSLGILMTMFIVGSVCLAAEKSKVVAVVGGEEITEEYLEYALRNVPQKYREGYEDQAGRLKMLENIIQMRLLASAAKTEGLEKRPEVRMQLKDREAGVLSSAYVKHLVEAVKVTDSDLEAYYREHAEMFTVPESVKMRHIVLKTEEDAKSVLESLQKGSDFGALAREKSIHTPSKDKGGDLGWVPRGLALPEIEQAAFSLEEGKISEIVKTSNGYHIIKVEGKRPKTHKELAEVKETIRTLLEGKKQRETIEKKISELRQKLDVKVFMGDEKK